MTTKLTGVPQWQRNLNRSIGRIENHTEGGLLEAALYVKALSQKEAPKATGNLANSAFVVSSNGKTAHEPSFQGKTSGGMAAKHSSEVADTKSKARLLKHARRVLSAWIGYSAVYALKVHENIRSGRTGGVSPSGKKYTSGRTGTGRKSKRVVWAEKGKWKFLEDPLKRSARKILSIITANARKATR